MVQIIKAEVSEALAENSGRMLWKFMVTGKGAIKAALEDLLSVLSVQVELTGKF